MRQGEKKTLPYRRIPTNKSETTTKKIEGHHFMGKNHPWIRNHSTKDYWETGIHTVSDDLLRISY